MAVGITSYKCATVSSVSTKPQKGVKFRSVTGYKGNLIKRLYHADNIDVLNCLVKDEDVWKGKSYIYRPSV